MVFLYAKAGDTLQTVRANTACLCRHRIHVQAHDFLRHRRATEPKTRECILRFCQWRGPVTTAERNEYGARGHLGSGRVLKTGLRLLT